MSVLLKLKNRLQEGKHDGIYTNKEGSEIEVYYLSENEASLFLPDEVKNILEVLDIPCKYFHKNETITINKKDRQ